MSKKYKERNKGTSLIAFPKDYIMLDVETTGRNPNIDCIIEIAAIKVINNQIIDSYQTLVSPGCVIPDNIIQINNITNDMVAGAPTIEKVLPEFLDFVGKNIIIGHNVNFDINFIYDCAEKYFDTNFDNDFVDTLRLSRLLVNDIEHYTLLDMVRHFNIPKKTAHRALSDCEMTIDLLNNLEKIAIEKYKAVENIPTTITSKKSYSKTLNAKDLKPNTDVFDISHPLYNQNCVFTGTLDKMSRKSAMQAVLDLGGYVLNGVNKKTDYLIIGNYDYASYNTLVGEKSSKRKKAEKYNLEGCNIQIINEDVFYELLDVNNSSQEELNIDETDDIIQENLFDNESNKNTYYLQNIEGTIDDILSVVKSCINKKYLKLSTITIEESKSKDFKNLYYIRINSDPTTWRPDATKNTFARIKFGNSCYIAFSDSFKKEFDNLEIKYTKIKSESLLRISFDVFFKLDKIILTNLFNKIFINLFSIPTFGCCGKFSKCEKDGYCIHDDMIYATACSYRKFIRKEPIKASELNIDSLKQLKRDLKLPTTKQLIYYRQIAYSEYKVFEVVDFEIEKELPSSKILKIYLDNGDTVLIMCDFLVEMQKPNFTQIVSVQVE